MILGQFTVTNGITLTGVILAAIVAIAVTVAYFRASLGRGTIEVYRQDNEALRGRVKTQDDDLADKDKRITELQATVAEKDQQIKHIADIATGATALDAFRMVEEKEHGKLNAFMERIDAALKKLVNGNG